MRLSPSKVHNATKFLLYSSYYRLLPGLLTRPIAVRGFRPVLVSIPALTSFFTAPPVPTRTITTWAQRAELEMSSESSSSSDKAEKNQKQQNDRKDEDKKELPKLTPAEFRTYNRMAEHMDYFHNHFRHSWNELYTACSNNKRPSGMSIRQFINLGLQFVSHLSVHHQIEEQSIFPILAKKMRDFRPEVHLLKQHKDIHIGMDKLEAYLEQCRNGSTELRLDEMKKIMDSFGAVLWAHLDDEVRTLGAENMRKYWTMDEIRRLPI